MAQIKIDLVYRDGAFHPQTPVSIPEGIHASVVIDLPTPNASPMTPDEVHDYLVRVGLALPKGPAMTPLLSPEARRALAQELSGGKPASEMILEDREERF